MKITIAYIPEEAEKAAIIHRFVQGLIPGIRVHESDAHPPFKHIYLTTRNVKSPSGSKENTCNTPGNVV